SPGLRRIPEAPGQVGPAIPRSSFIAHTAKAKVVESAVRRRVAACGGPVVRTVIFAAQPRAATHCAFSSRNRAVRINCGTDGIILLIEPVGTPLPDIARHIVKAVTVRREAAHRRAPLEAVFTGVETGEAISFIRENSLPPVGDRPAAGPQFIAPDKLFSNQPAARRVFPLGFSRQPLPRPPRISRRVIPRNL